MDQTPTPELVEQRMKLCEDLPRHIAWRKFAGWPASIDVDDLIQVARIELWELARKTPADIPGNFRALATTAMTRQLIDMRRSLLGKEGQRAGVACTFEINHEVMNMPGESRAHFEDLDEIRQAFANVKLSERQQQIVELLFLDYTRSEIASEIGTSVQYVGKAIRTVHAKLAEHITPSLRS
jgi:RNA polymerase sigma factor (sigma-70 family)